MFANVLAYAGDVAEYATLHKPGGCAIDAQVFEVLVVSEYLDGTVPELGLNIFQPHVGGFKDVAINVDVGYGLVHFLLLRKVLPPDILHLGVESGRKRRVSALC